MKGAELPLTVLVVVILGIIILMTLVVAFNITLVPSRSDIGIEAARSSACQTLVSTGCDDDLSSIEVSGVNGVDDFDSLCRFKIFPNDADYKNKCLQMCGCTP